ncbi:hypothetical protein [Chitinimonas koreensis]|uniref:hypothetical protein n=1 Tax=Chitinimonas koreensis TaxID=356302 RepID=UPI0004266536|nr:hypothetical protein [Chitinimonas koreensis]
MGAPDTTAASQAGCGCQGSCDACAGSLPDAPDCAINYHFGMLLGVEDFRVEQGFHVGRLRRHQRALHGSGVVYGYGVEFDAARRELKVAPGYALDRRGRDLELAEAQCLGLPAWWEKHRDDDDFLDLADKDNATFDAEVVLCHGSCLSRPVPAIADPCAGDGSPGIAYSRICERPVLSLRRARPPAPAGVPSYRLLRVLLGLAAAEAGDAWLAERQADIAALPPGERAAATEALWRTVLTRAAIETGATADAAPASDLAEDDDGCLVLARLGGLHLFRDAEGWQVALADPPDPDHRATLLPTEVLQALLLRPGVAGPAVDTAEAVAGGPRVVAASWSSDSVTLDFDLPLAPPSVAAPAFTVTAYGPTGWTATPLAAAPPVYADAERRVTLTLAAAPAADTERLRITVRGSGPTPLLGADLTPAGAPAADRDGLDLSTQVTGS